MFREQPNGGMTEIDAHSIEFVEDEFPSIGVTPLTRGGVTPLGLLGRKSISLVKIKGLD